MADIASRDQNNVPTLLGASNVDGTPVKIYADPVTHRLLVNQTGGGSTTLLTTTVLWIDGNRVDTYTATGTIQSPYKKISDAITGSSGLAAVSYIIAPATYVEASNVTFPNVPISILANNSTLVCNGGAGTVTFQAGFDLYGFQIVGNVVQSDTSLTTTHNFLNGSITGAFTASGLVAITNQNMVGGLITVNAGSQVGFAGTFIVDAAPGTARILNSGILYFNGSRINTTNNSNYAITATAAGSVVYISGAVVQNLGTGGGINCANGATSQPNEISSIDVILKTGSTNAIDCGTAVSSVNNYNAIDQVGTTIYATGSNLIAGVQSQISNTGAYKDSTHSSGSNTNFLSSTATATLWVNAATARTNLALGNDFVWTITGGTSAITVPAAGVPSRPSKTAGTLTGWYVDADAAGSITIDVQKATRPAVGSAPSFSSIIGAGTAPSLSSQISNFSTTLTSWTTTFNATDLFRIVISAPATCKWVTVQLTYNTN